MSPVIIIDIGIVKKGEEATPKKDSDQAKRCQMHKKDIISLVDVIKSIRLPVQVQPFLRFSFFGFRGFVHRYRRVRALRSCSDRAIDTVEVLTR